MLLFFLLFTSIFLLYGLSISKWPCLEDDSLFILAAYFNDVSHPPGYPLFTNLAHIATKVPFSSIAFRVHLISAFFSALSAYLLFLIIRNFSIHSSIAIFSALLFAVSPIIWSQSIVAEVYSLHLFLFFLLILISQKIDSKVSLKTPYIYLFSFCYGLSLANHWPLTVLGSSYFVFIFYPYVFCKNSRLKTNEIFFSLCFLFLGLLPYLHVWNVLTSKHTISLYGEISSFSELVSFISRSAYSGIDFSPSATFIDRLNFLKYFFKVLFSQAPIIFLPFPIAGLIYQFKIIGKRLSSALVVSFLSSSLLLIFLLNFDFTEINRAIVRVYFLLPYSIFFIWLAFGLSYFITLFSKSLPKIFSSNKLQISSIVVIIFSLAFLNFSKISKHNFRLQKLYANFVDSTLPNNSELFVKGDAIVGGLVYEKLIENKFINKELREYSGLLLDNRIFNPREIQEADIVKTNLNYILSSNKEIFSISNIDFPLGGKYFWLIKSLHRANDKRINYAGELNSSAFELFDDLVKVKNSKLYLNDPWVKMYVDQLLALSIPSLEVRIEKARNSDIRSVYINYLGAALDSYQGKMIYAQNLLQKNSTKKALLYAKESLAIAESESDKVKEANSLNLMSKIEMLGNNKEKANSYRNRSISLWPHPKNQAL